MDGRERKIFLETKLRNLKRSYAKVINHAELTDEADLLHEKIKTVEENLSKL